MAYGTRVNFETEREVGFASVTASFTAIGAATISHGRMVRIVSTLNQDVYISLDGTNIHMRIAAGSFVLYDFATNRIQDDGMFLKEGTTFYIEQTSGGAPTTGTLWIEIVYAQGGV